METLKKVKALINPDLLKWFLEESGYTLEAFSKKMDKKKEKIMKWLKGRDNPSFPELYKIAEILKRPPAAFYLSKIPKKENIIHDFRGRKEYKLSPNAKYYIRLAKTKRENSIELAKELNENLNVDFPIVNLEQSPEQLADKIRIFFHKEFNEIQIKSKTPADLFLKFRYIVESKDILVFQTQRVSLEEFRGLSIVQRPFPIILINSSDAPVGKIFTLFHEVGHILLRQEGICDMHTSNLLENDKKIEKWCNHLSGAILCPHYKLKEIINLKKFNKFNEITINELADFFKISRETIARRLLYFEYITTEEYRKYRKLFNTGIYKNKTGFAKYKYRVLNLNGINYSNRIFTALANNFITPFEASNYLNVNIKYINKIGSALFERLNKL